MSFVFAERTRNAFNGSTIESIQVYSDTKVELDGAVRLNWPCATRRAVNRFGICKVIIPCPTLCVAFAGNNLWGVKELCSWMVDSSPFEVSELIMRAHKIHLEARNRDDIEFLICETDTNESGRIVCIKNGAVHDNQITAWIGSPIAFNQLQEMRMKALEGGKNESPDTFTLFDDLVNSSKDEAVGGFTISVALRDGEFHFNEYLRARMYRSQLVQPGESVQLFDSVENGGYAVGAFELDCCPALSFPQINKTVIYTNKYRYPDGSLDIEGLSQFYLPMLLETGTWVCIEP